ncbi:reverse transcriptase domain-containing protein [Tanacetum coccineum]
MADNRTMAQMLQAPIEGYEDAIVVPPINANNFELKQPLINLVQSNKFTGRQDPHNHLRFFNKVTSTFRHPEVPNTSIKLLLFPFSLDGEARDWLDKEPPRSILTWDDLVSKFINQFFPPSKTKITNFFQEPNEIFNEAWERFKGLIRQSASLEDKMTIKMNKMLNEMKALVVTTPAPVKAVEEVCVTCGSNHHFNRNFDREKGKSKSLTEVFGTSGCLNVEVTLLKNRSSKLLALIGGTTIASSYPSMGAWYVLKYTYLSPLKTDLNDQKQTKTAKRRNRTLLDMVRSMMSQTTLPKSFWDYALESAAHIFNMVSTKKVDKTPYEMQSMRDNEVWELVDLPPNGKTVGHKWLFKKKTDMDGAVHTYKARLVAKGFTQTPWIDYEETFSPVADIRAIRILIAIAAFYDYEIWQMDVKSTFLMIFLMKRCTRPDVAFAQNMTSRFQQDPGELHWTTVKNILKYLRNTKYMFLVYEGDTKRELRVSCYTDDGYLTDAGTSILRLDMYSF